MDGHRHQQPPQSDELERLGAEYEAALDALYDQAPTELRPTLIGVERARHAYWRALCREIAAEAAVEAIEALVGESDA